MADVLLSQISDTKTDIKSLELEINNLKTDKSLLLAQIQKLERGEPLPEEDDSVPILQHKYFNEIIQEFFPQLKQVETDNGEAEDSGPVKRLKVDLSMLNMALLENIYRFGGVTAFPLNQYLLEEDGVVIGLRFDIYTANRFSTPHYVIVRKEQPLKAGTEGSPVWRIFKHTIPVFVPIRQYESEFLSLNDLVGFVKHVRLYFVRLQYKHEKFDQLKGFGYRIEKDLQCRRVVLEKPKELIIEVMNTEDSIEDCRVILNMYDKSYERLIISSLQNCEIKSLVKVFRSIAQQKPTTV